MKQHLKNWALRLTATGVFILALLLGLILTPMLTYGRVTRHNNYFIYHNQVLDPKITASLDQATSLLKTSSFYNPELRLDICLNDGSTYPTLVETVHGPAFACGFYNKVVIQGKINTAEHCVERNGYHWNFVQLLAHEMIHCLQVDRLGILKSNPIASIPTWKWEGYAEYVARQHDDQKDLEQNITRLFATHQDQWDIRFADNTSAPRTYYEDWLLVQYCMDIKKMNYEELLADTTREQVVKEEMMRWYHQYK